MVICPVVTALTGRSKTMIPTLIRYIIASTISRISQRQRIKFGMLFRNAIIATLSAACIEDRIFGHIMLKATGLRLVTVLIMHAGRCVLVSAYLHLMIQIVLIDLIQVDARGFPI